MKKIEFEKIKKSGEYKILQKKLALNKLPQYGSKMDKYYIFVIRRVKFTQKT